MSNRENKCDHFQALPTTQSATTQADQPEEVPQEDNQSEQLTPDESEHLVIKKVNRRSKVVGNMV